MDVVSAPVPEPSRAPQTPHSPFRPRLIKGTGASAIASAVAVTLMALVPLLMLVKAAAIGAFVRPISDDYCQVAWVKVDGFWGLVEHYWQLNGRVGNALVSTLVHLTPIGIRVLPALVAAAAVAASALLVARLLRVNGWAAPRPAIAAVALAFSCALILREDGNFYQTFLWAPGNVTHTLPWVLAVALAALAVGTRSRLARVLVWPALFLGGLLLGTLTEILSVLICALLALLVAARGWHRRRLGRNEALALFGATSVGVGVLVLLSSPGLANRRGAVSPLDPTVLRGTLRVWPEVLQHSVFQPWTVVPLVAGLALGVLVRPSCQVTGAVPHRALLGWSAVALMIALVGGSLLTIDADITAFGPKGPMQYPRTWLDFMAATACCLLLVGVLLGRGLAERVLGEPETAGRALRDQDAGPLPSHTWRLALIAVVASLAVVAVGADQFSRVSSVDRTARERASAWDAQERSVKAQVAAGVQKVVYRSQPIARLSEPFAGTRATFAAGCAATYFGADRLVPPAAATK